MNTLTVRSKLILAFVSLSLAVILIALLALKTLSDSNRNFESYVHGVGARADTAHLVREAVDLRAVSARNLVLVSKAEDVEVEKAIVLSAQADVTRRLAELNKLAALEGVSDKARQLIGEIDRIEALYGPVALAIVDMALKKDLSGAIEKMNTECRPLLAQLIKASNAYNDYTAVHVRELIDASTAEYGVQRNLFVSGCVVVVIAAVLAGVLIIRSIVGPINEAVEVAESVAGGNLAYPIKLGSQDEIGRLLSAMARMQVGLVRVVSGVRERSQGVAIASAEIALGNHELSART